MDSQSRILVIAGGVLAVFGVAMAVLAGTSLFGPVNALIDPAFWATGPDPATADFRSWAYGAWGATVAGWGLLVAFVGAGPFARHERWAWYAIASATALWFVLDTGISLAHGVVANAALNTVLVLIVAVPLFSARGAFRRR